MAEISSNDPQFREAVLEVLDEVGAHIQGNDIETVNTVDENVVLPGYKIDGHGDPVKYVCAPMTIFAQYAQFAAQAIQAAWMTWFGATDADGIRNVWTTFYNTSTQEWVGLKSDAQQATRAASTAAINAQDAIDGAEHVNATLSGTTITVTNRNGQSSSANLKGEKGDTGAKGDKGDKGDAFTYSDFTQAQIDALKGDKGEKGDKGDKGEKGDKGDTGAKGDKGDAFTYSDFTQAQIDALKGDKGEKGDKGDDLHWDEMSQSERENMASYIMSQIVFASEQECRQAVHELSQTQNQ